MLLSMTGYGRGRSEGWNRQFTVELRAVNHRFLEVVVRGSRDLVSFDDRVRNEIQARLQRGRVEVLVAVRFSGDRPRQVKVDKSLALAYYNGLKELEAALGIDPRVRAVDIAGYPDVMTAEEPEQDMEALWAPYREALSAALDGLVDMRTKEGVALREDLELRIACLRRCREEIASRAPLVVGEYRARLESRLTELLGGRLVDEQRLAHEVAIFAERCSIDEELSRLASHIDQMEKTLDEIGGVGRKLEFLLQEMNREVNTIGSKSSDIDISRSVVQAKSELEKIREQAQNVE